jgi:hypothetical protein
LRDLAEATAKPISPEGVVNQTVSRDDKWVLVGVRDAASGKVNTALLSIDDGQTVEIKGLKPAELTLGWTSDGQIYVG